MSNDKLSDSAGRSVDFDPFAGAEIGASFPTTEPQKEVWLSSQLGSDASCAYNESIVLELVGDLSAEELEHALNDVVARHDALRATISADGESLLVAESLRISLPVEDWTGRDGSTQASDIQGAKLQEVTTPFDLRNGPLIRARLIRLSPTKHNLFVSAHHVVCDGWSFEPLISDLSRLYTARVQGSEAALPVADSFKTYVDRQLEPDYLEEIEASTDYWLDRFRTLPQQTEFAPDNPRPKERSFEADCLLWELPASLMDGLHSLSTSHRTSLMVTMLCAFEVFVHRLTGLRDIVIGVPSAGQLAFDCPALVGHCVNLLPMRTYVEPTLTFEDYLASRRAQALGDFDNQKFTYGSLIKSLRLGRDPSRMPLTALMFNIDQPLDGVDFEGLECQIGSNHRKFEAFEQFFNVAVESDKVVIECQYNTNLFEESVMRHRLESFQALLQAVVDAPGRVIEQLSIVSEPQTKMLFDDLGAGHRLEIRQPSCIAEFDSIVESAPDAIACEFGDVSLSYSRLSELSNSLASALSARQIGPGDKVGLLLRRSEMLLISMLGVMKAGAAFVPLDPEFPQKRLDFIIEDAGMSAVLVEDDTIELTTEQSRCVPLAELMNDGHEASDLRKPPEGKDNAYMIYTSGSTGRPKGVQISHRNLLNFLLSMADTPGLDRETRLLAVTSASFDISILEMLGPLMVGGTVVIADADTTKDGVLLRKALETKGISCMQATPSTWRMLFESGWEGNKKLLVMCGGEAVSPDLADRLAAKHLQAWNMYGPTETTIWSTVGLLSAGERPVRLGAPIHNTRLYVLDSNRQVVPPGIAGELYIGGDGVAMQYWKRPELTEQKFVELPFADGMVYSTGDEVRYLSDGGLEFLGRLDGQIKLHGYRIELGDIEAAIQRHENVAEVAVTVKEFGQDDKRLVAYVRTRDGDVEATEVRKFVSDDLPSYMIPHHVVQLAEFPLTPNRKLDRKALPLPEGGKEIGDSDRGELETDTQRAIADIWKRVLGVGEVGSNDDFFDLGGHSILVTKVVALIKTELQQELPFRRFFEAPVLADVADAVDALAVLSEIPSGKNHSGEVEEIEF
ncbi:MAG: amino acid adenylation domain-containing protein [Woeseiaceae bacterium]|nr:amino acid adenylation domain-containing protein [Woeseiaceae bacterium]